MSESNSGSLRGCKVCGALLEPGGVGRRKLTCSEPCSKLWANAKRRASRARSNVLRDLSRAAASANEVGSLWARVMKLHGWVERHDPCRLAEVLERDKEQFDPASQCVWPKSAL